jgi:hypothetical protein
MSAHACACTETDWQQNNENIYFSDLSLSYQLEGLWQPGILSFLVSFVIGYSRDSSVGITLGYRLDDRSSRVRFPAGAGNFSLHHHVQNGSGAHSASYSVGTRALSRGAKLTTHLHLVPRSKNAWSHTTTLPIRLHGVVLSLKKHRDSFTFTFTFVCYWLLPNNCHVAYLVRNNTHLPCLPVRFLAKFLQLFMICLSWMSSFSHPSNSREALLLRNW